MPDRFTETTRTSYGSRIVNSVGGVFVGFLIFIASFGVIYWNEGRVDLSSIAKTAVEISPTVVNADPNISGDLVSVTGIVESDEIIGDNLFLKSDKFVAMKREVEMYAWKETVESTSRTDFGGGETTETTYTYTKEWQENIKSSSSFRHPEDHENPEKSLDSLEVQSSNARVGVYDFNPQAIHLPNFSDLKLNSQNVNLNSGAILANDNYLFIRKSANGTFENPQIGDIRVSYHVLRPGFEGTIFGKLNGDGIDSYSDEDGNSLYRLFAGTREEALVDLHTEYKVMLWLFRLLGFIMMWMGLSGLLGPVSVLLSIVPFLGSLSRMMIGLATFLISLILSSVAILVSMIVHNIIALVIALVLAVGVIIYVLVRLKKSRLSSVGRAPLT